MKGDKLLKSNELSDAYITYEELRNYYTECGHDSGATMVNNKLAKVKVRLRMFDDAREHYKRVLKFATKMEYSDLIAAAQNDIGCTYFDELNLDSSAYYFNLAEMTLLESRNFTLLGRMRLNKGVLLNEIGQTKEAIEVMRLAVYPVNPVFDTLTSISASNNIGACFIDLDQFDSAYYHLNEGLRKASEFGFLKQRLNSNLNLGHLHYNFEKFQDACDYYEEYYLLKDSIYSIETAVEIARIEKEYEFAKEKLALKNAELKTLIFQRWAIVLAAMFFIGLIIVYSVYKRRKAIQKVKTQAIISTREEENKRITDLLWKEIGASTKGGKLSLPGQELPEHTIPGAIAAVRFLSNQQFNPYLQLGLTKAVDNLINVLSKGKDIKVERKLEDIEIDKQNRLIYYRVIENILVEVFSQLNTSNVEVELSRHKGELHFQAATDKVLEKSQLRFQSAEARIQQFDGKLKFEIANSTTKIKVVIPLA